VRPAIFRKALLGAVLALAGVVAWSGYPASAQQGCTPTQHSAALSSSATYTLVRLGPVPEGRTWHIRAAGVSTGYGGEAEYMMELHTPAADGTCCYYVPIARAYSARGTPALALGREIDLRAGEYLSARAWLRGVEDQGYKISLLATWDETCN
jgi:hypothetical protein